MSRCSVKTMSLRRSSPQPGAASGGSAERGADFVCTHLDPLGTQHTVAVQVKMHAGDADPRALDQLARARAEYPSSLRASSLRPPSASPGTWPPPGPNSEENLGIPIRMILRRELLELFLRYLRTWGPLLPARGTRPRGGTSHLRRAQHHRGPHVVAGWSLRRWRKGHPCRAPSWVQAVSYA